MKNLLDRIENLEAIAARWNLSQKVYTSYDQHNRVVTEYTFSQKVGQKRGKSIEFETEREALDWIVNQMEYDPEIRAQIGVDDLRSIMPDDACAAFDYLFPDAPEHVAWFDLRDGQDPITEAVRRWRRGLCGVKYNEWWNATNKRLDELLAPE